MTAARTARANQAQRRDAELVTVRFYDRKCVGTIAFIFVILRHGSLFVTEGGTIVGLLRFSDVYAWIKEIVRADPAS